MAFAIKAAIDDPLAETFLFAAQKTMYGGRRVAVGDTMFMFASENAGGQGLFARGVVVAAEAVPRTPGIARQTPRVTVAIDRIALATQPLGRRELKPFTAWSDGQPASELNFKFYRQATDKIAGLSDAAAAFLDTFF